MMKMYSIKIMENIELALAKLFYDGYLKMAVYKTGYVKSYKKDIKINKSKTVYSIDRYDLLEYFDDNKDYMLSDINDEMSNIASHIYLYNFL